ncbi:glycerophosphodiester phosphodiesterase [Bailinhaonella thermotolerans]|uniref:glycerophosphodiester phosphodiesterase n=1 Tax=Bailinhaonella thermotolerans TaxID=1070861 RepID=A0A3A4ALE7_9ACTN|nr:glycerophosphodiester phosphodiesterase [Bailinhaonella thermotolerans]RJL26613.1 glycerophosphodiester phosphodiesterase [Bailinhaonella thermotolerans]
MRGLRKAAAVLVAAVALGPGAAVAEAAPSGRAEREPVVIGHRGASGHRPEHTIAAYTAAIDMGADYIEPDLVSTKDRVLVARHENEISGTTDVEKRPEFAGRRTTKTIDGVPVTGWFTEDFTLAELRTLRAEERVPELRPDNAAYDGLYQIPTFDEVLELARRRGVGVYPETKHPTYFDRAGLSLEEPLLASLRRFGLTSPRSPVIIQSFETANLRELRSRTRVRLAQLLSASGAPYDLVAAGDPRTYADLAKPEGLAWIAGYADGVGVNTALVIPAGPDGRLGEPTSLVRDAHRRGLSVHVWTVRNENSQLPLDHRQGNPASPAYGRATGDVMGWLKRLFEQRVDGVFADDPGMARAVRERLFN